jgi:protease I
MAEPARRPAQRGSNWVDEEVVVCSSGPNTLVSSRTPDDLPAFCTTMVDAFAACR